MDNLEPVANGAENFLQSECCFSLQAKAQWTLRDNANCAMMPLALLRPMQIGHVFTIPYGVMNFMAALELGPS